MLRYPLTTLFTKTTNATASFESTFTLPNYDIDAVVAKLTCSTFVVGDTGNTYDIYIQTSDDGGTTFYDCAHFIQIMNAAGVISNANARFINIPVNVGSSLNIGSPGSGSITASSISGLPLMGVVGRIHWVMSAAGTSTASITVSLLANNQSGGQY